MATSRINKFIFSKINTFLRLKTVAKDLKVKKDGINYVIEIPQAISANEGVVIPVEVTADFDLASKTADQKFTQKAYAWGNLVKLINDKENCYFVIPKNSKYVVQVGPMASDLEGRKIEIDWENLQWVEN